MCCQRDTLRADGPVTLFPVHRALARSATRSWMARCVLPGWLRIGQESDLLARGVWRLPAGTLEHFDVPGAWGKVPAERRSIGVVEIGVLYSLERAGSPRAGHYAGSDSSEFLPDASASP
jgi:hypothetical protein